MLLRSLFVLAVAALAASVQAQTFTNAANITIPNSGTATPYPSIINVVGGPAAITNVTVVLNNISHTYSGDIAIVLVGPQFQKVALLGYNGGFADFVSNTLTFSDGGIPFQPSVNNAFLPTGLNATIPGPAPAGPYGSQLSVFNGTNSNGAWLLYVFDGVGGDLGAIAGGWSITFNQPLGTGTPSPTPNVFTYQGKLENGGTPVTGAVDIRATLYRNGGNADVGALASVQVDGVQVSNGLFTTIFNFGDMAFDDKDLYLGLAVRNPSGGGSFVTLAGRQRVTPAPAAQWASASDQSHRVSSPDSALSLVNTDNSGNIGIGRPADQLGGGTVVIEGRLGTAASNFGGMYVNTPHADAWPFMGFSSGGTIRSYWYHDPAVNGIRFNNGTQLRNSGEMSIDGAPVAGFTLSVNGSLRCVGLTNASSGRYKTDVEPLGSVLDRFEQLRPVTYVWNDQAPASVRGQKTTGLIAEEVYALFPDAISLDSQGRPDGIDYSRVTAISIQAFKELQAKQAAKDAEIDALKARLETIERLLERSAK